MEYKRNPGNWELTSQLLNPVTTTFLLRLESLSFRFLKPGALYDRTRNLLSRSLHDMFSQLLIFALVASSNAVPTPRRPMVVGAPGNFFAVHRRAASADVVKQNGLTAQAQNAAFAALTVNSSCSSQYTHSSLRRLTDHFIFQPVQMHVSTGPLLNALGLHSP